MKTLKPTREHTLQWLLRLSALAGAALNLAGCLAGSDDCQFNAQRCSGEHAMQRCLDSESGNFWATDQCDGQHPYCVTVENSPVRSRVECIAEPHCSATAGCSTLGLCADGPNGCVPTAEGCANSCIQGRCGFNGSVCTPTDEGCASSAGCESVGVCGGGALECSATALGCASSNFCKSDGFCALIGTLCEPTAAGCASSEACRVAGTCGISSETRCEATVEGCAKSVNCLASGQCLLVDHLCQATAESCAKSPECKEHGFCRLQNGICYQ